MTGQVTAYVSQIVTPDHVTGQVTFPRSRAGKDSGYEGRFVTQSAKVVTLALGPAQAHGAPRDMLKSQWTSLRTCSHHCWIGQSLGEKARQTIKWGTQSGDIGLGTYAGMWGPQGHA